jgi:hypothetical protein
MKAVAGLLLLLPLAVCAADEAVAHFNAKVRPLLESRCVSCHGTEKQKGGLRLDSREAAMKGGDTGPAIVPGKPADSLLLQSVMHAKKELTMPPKEKLTVVDIAVLERWVRDGAPWPAEVKLTASRPQVKAGERLGDAWTDPRNPIVRIFGGQRLDLWSLKPVAPVRVPDGAANPIDALLGAKPAPEADARTLIRRLSFSLTGLPPTPEEVTAFAREWTDPAQRPEAYGKLVDRLLASPRFGEHQARWWLDVVRYSDSNGFDWDEFRPRAWRFRDYVVRAFNTDKPFDRFIREQLAGDELLAGPPHTPEEQDALIATGYLRLGPTDNAAQLFNEQDRARAEWMADLTETTGSAFLGLTLSCCRCHDHKFDPLSQADHFRIRAFFEPIKTADDMPLDLAADQEAINQANAKIKEQVEPLVRERDALTNAGKERVREERKAKLSAEERALLETPREKCEDKVKEQIAALEKKLTASDDEAKAALTDAEKKRRDELKKQIDAAKKRERAFTIGLLATDKPDAVPATHILFQGDHKSPRDEVVAGFPSALDPNPAEIHRAANERTTGRRATLAEWIASPKNPLTARVIVNRVWQSHFGTGLVATPNDFGLAGARPANPELLDWLAGEFIRSGWSLKKLHRLVVMSGAYRAGGPREPRRLSAEQLRDTLLAVSGLLKERSGGPPIWPELPAEVLQANPAFLDDNTEKTKGWYPSPAQDQHVRSLYLVQKRTVHVPFMETFDLPQNSVSCARRIESTVAPQALSLLNSPLVTEVARAFAQRVEREAGVDPRAQVTRAFALTVQREPAEAELAACLRLREQRSLVELCRALVNVNEFLYVD